MDDLQSKDLGVVMEEGLPSKNEGWVGGEVGMGRQSDTSERYEQQ